MTDEDYENFCKSKWRNPLAQVTAEFSERYQIDCVIAALGLGGEAGEVQELVKKFEVHGRLTDVDRLIEELGDVEYYLARLRSLYGISREEILEANVTKLDARYPERK